MTGAAEEHLFGALSAQTAWIDLYLFHFDFDCLRTEILLVRQGEGAEFDEVLSIGV
jgi:hypothetical protein